MFLETAEFLCLYSLPCKGKAENAALLYLIATLLVFPLHVYIRHSDIFKENFSASCEGGTQKLTHLLSNRDLLMKYIDDAVVGFVQGPLF